MLKSTIESIVPQLTSEVELLVSDNASTDNTSAYLSQISNQIEYYCQHENIGGERNMLTCLGLGSGQFIWLLNDDDAISHNAVAVILSAIRLYPSMPLLWARAASPSLSKPLFLDSTCRSSWTEMNGDSFLTSIAEWITFCPSIIVRRQNVSIPILEPYLGSLLIPTALTLHALAQENKALVSDDPLVFPQEGEIGRYDVFSVFTHSIRRVCAPFQHRPFSPLSLEQVYKSCYIRVIGDRIYNWPLSMYSSWNLMRYGLRYMQFYRMYLPAMLRRFWRSRHFSLKRITPSF